MYIDNLLPWNHQTVSSKLTHGLNGTLPISIKQFFSFVRKKTQWKRKKRTAQRELVHQIFG